MATARRVKSHNRKSTYRRIKTKGGTKSFFVKGGGVKSHYRRSK